MKKIFLITCSFLFISMLVGCNSDRDVAKNSKQNKENENSIILIEDSNDPQLVDNPSDLMPMYRQQMVDLYNDNTELLHKIFSFISADGNIFYIQADGYVVYKDERQKWNDELSAQIKVLCNLEGKDYTSMSLKAWEESGTIIFLEAYYPKTQTTYTILYSESEFVSESFWYTQLADNWYLLETPMT